MMEVTELVLQLQIIKISTHTIALERKESEREDSQVAE